MIAGDRDLSPQTVRVSASFIASSKCLEASVDYRNVMFRTIVLPVPAENSPAEKWQSRRKERQNKRTGTSAGVQASAAHVAA